MPDYEIIRWDESNFDINQNQYCREAYAAKKYAFVSDYIRVSVLYQYGGIYMDTDVELLQSLSEDILSCDGFSGYETSQTIPTGIMGSIPGLELFEKLLNFYHTNTFINPDGSYNDCTNVKIITDIAISYGFTPDGTKKTVLGFTLFPQTFFCPLSHDSEETCFSKNTYTIHHFSGSWCDRKTRFVGIWNKQLGKKVSETLGAPLSGIIYRVLYNVCRLLDHMQKR